MFIRPLSFAGSLRNEGKVYAAFRGSRIWSFASLQWCSMVWWPRVQDPISRISQKGLSTCLQTFASILYFRWFSQSCYIWQHSLLAFDKQLLPNVSKETCQMLELRFNCWKKNAVWKSLLLQSSCLVCQFWSCRGPQLGQIVSLKVESRLPAVLGSLKLWMTWHLLVFKVIYLEQIMSGDDFASGL